MTESFKFATDKSWRLISDSVEKHATRRSARWVGRAIGRVRTARQQRLRNGTRRRNPKPFRMNKNKPQTWRNVVRTKRCLGKSGIPCGISDKSENSRFGIMSKYPTINVRSLRIWPSVIRMREGSLTARLRYNIHVYRALTGDLKLSMEVRLNPDYPPIYEA